MEEEKIVNLGGVSEQIPFPTVNPGNQIPGQLPSPKEAFSDLIDQNKFKGVGNIPVSSFYTDGQRYPETRPFTDFEEMAAQQQSAFDQWRFGIGKGVGILGTTAVQGTVGLLYGIGSAILNQKFSKLYDNSVTRYMDDLQKQMEDYAPNYYSRAEQDAEWWSPDNILTPNFWADKVIKNIGFGLGSMVGGFGWTKAFKLINQANSLVKLGRGAQVSANIERAMEVVPKAQKISAIENTLSNLYQGTRQAITTNGDRVLTSVMGTFGEASIESLQKINEFRDNAIAEYRRQNGTDPVGEDLNEINEFAEKAGNYVWGMNTLLLSATNYVQLPKIFGSSRKSEKAFINKITQEGIGKEFIEQLPKKRFRRYAEDAFRGVSGLFAPSESLEEGLQFAIATGVDDFFNRAYENREDLGTFLETTYSAMGNVFGEGVEKTLSTKEGMESIVIGALSGGIQQAPMRIYQEGLTGRGGARDRNTQLALNELNASNINKTLQEQADFLSIGIGSQALRQRAIQNNDILSEKDYEYDYALSYLMPRAKYGKIESVYNELNYYKEQASTVAGFTELQSAGIAFENESASQFIQRIGTLENTAKAVEKHYDNINETYSGVYKTDEEGNVIENEKGQPVRKYNPVVIDKLVYAASKIDNYSQRIPELTNNLSSAGINISTILSDILVSKKPAKDAVKEALDQINSMDTIADVKDDLKRSLSDVIEISLRRKNFIDQYDSIKGNPEVYEVFSPAERVREKGPVDVVQKEGRKNVKKTIEVGREYSLSEPIKLEKGKLVLAPKLTVLSETLGGEFEVRLPDGREVFMSPLEFRTYNITEEDNTSQELEDILNESIDDVLNYSAFRDVVEKPEEGVNKLDYINSLDNQKLTRAVINRFNKTAREILEKKAKQKAVEDAIKSSKDSLDKQQETISDNDLDSFPVGVLPEDAGERVDTGETGRIKDASDFFDSSITESEEFEDTSKSKPHIIRSRIFLNNARKFKNRNKLRAIVFTYNQEESLGLSGITALSFGMTQEQVDADVNGFETKVTNSDNGFVGMVFVEVSGKKRYFVDQDGKRIGEVGQSVDLGRVVFQTMPSTSITDSRGNDRYRKDQKEDFVKFAQIWRARREELMKPSTVPPMLEFRVSRGFAITQKQNGVYVKNPVTKALVDDKALANPGLINVVTTDTIEHNGEIIKSKKGYVYIQNGEMVQYLNNNKLGKDKATTVYQLIKSIVAKLQKDASEGKSPKFEENKLMFIKNILNYKKPVGEIRDNQLWFDLATLKVTIGNQSFDFADIENQETEIINYLSEVYHSANAKTLRKADSFFEYFYKDDKLQEREWVNYQSYLASGKDATGKNARPTDQVPFVTIANPTEAQPYPFAGKYATLINFEVGDEGYLPTVEDKNLPTPTEKKIPTSPSEVVVEETVTAGEFKLNDGTVNTIEYKAGPFKFKANLLPNGDVEIDTISEEINKEVFSNLSKNEKIIAATKKLFPSLVENASDEQVAKLYLLWDSQKKVTSALAEEQAKQTPSPPAAPQETKPAEEPTPPSTGSILGMLDSGVEDPDTRRIGIGESADFIDGADLEAFKNWHRENVPNIPFEVLENIINLHDGSKAWGVFEDGVAKFFKKGLRGTEYHEIFEGIWKAFLTESERQAILDEFKSRSGNFLDRESGQLIAYTQATDRQAKERIADDFADFRVGKLPARNLSQRIRNFFNSIIEFFKSFVRKPSLKDQLFEAIDTGKFKDYVVPEEVKAALPEYRLLSTPNGIVISEDDAYGIVQDMTLTMSEYIFNRNNEDGLEKLYYPRTATGKEIYNYLREKYSRNITILGEEVFEELFLRSKDLIRTMGINIDSDGILGLNDENLTDRLYAPEAFEVDFKKNMRFSVKFALATNPAAEKLYDYTKGAPQFLYQKDVNGKSTGLKLLNNFNKSFANLINALSNTSLRKVDDKLIELMREDGNYYRLFTRLRGDAKNGILDYSKFDKNDLRFYIQFIQAFAKSNPFVELSIQRITEGKVESYNIPGDRTSAIRKIRTEWFENVRELSKSETSFITKKREGGKAAVYVIDNSKESYPDKKNLLEPKRVQNYLKNIGIEFPLDFIEKINTNESSRKRFNNAVTKIYEIGPTGYAELSGDKFSKVDSHVRTLADMYVRVTNPDQDTTRFNVNNKRTSNFTDSNSTSVFEEEFNESNSLEELLQNRPELNDVFANNSLIVKQDGLFFDSEGNKIDGKVIEIGVIDGLIDETSDRGYSISSLTKGQRFTLEMNQNLEGKYYILIPADSSTERMLKLGTFVNYDLFNEGGNRAFTRIKNIFKGYLEDEVDLALDWENRSKLSATKSNAKELRFFKDILEPSLVEDIHKAIEDGKTREEIIALVSDQNLEQALRNTLDSLNQSTLTDLINSGEVQVAPITENESGYSYSKLNTNFTQEKNIDNSRMSEETLMQVLSYANMNYMIANIEMHKFIFGDPYQFKIKNGKLDETKRIKSWLSPRKKTIDSPEINQILNDKYNDVSEEISLDVNDKFRHVFKPYVKTVTLNDVNPFSRFIEKFGGYDEADGFSVMIDSSYREVKLKNGEWSEDRAEPWFQWNQAYARQKLSKKKKADGTMAYEYSDESLREYDKELISKPEPVFVTEVLKPIVSGSKFGVNRIEAVIDKFSQMPITYKMVEGTNLENLYIQMLDNKVGYVVYKSGRKEGVREGHSLYTKDGQYNFENFGDETIENISWKTYGIQVENSYQENKLQTRGSQLTKNDTMDMFQDGKEVKGMEGASRLAEEKIKIFKEMHENAYQEFLEKLGLEDLNGSYKLVDPVKISRELEFELLRRQASQNVMDTIRLDENGEFRIPFEASSAYEQIRSVLISMVNKSLISPRMNGKPHVQVPATLWENNKEGRKILRKTKDGYVEITRDQYEKLSIEEKRKVALASDTLKFYENKDGKRYMEVMIPNFWKKYFTDKNRFPNDKAILDYLNKPENQKILFGIGFRIPHQATSSTEVFKIKGFLDQSMGSTVVVPSEIVAKAGSDFDIDKLNMYLKSVYVDQFGNIKSIDYKGSKESTIDFYSKVYDETIQKQLDKIERYDEFREKVLEIFEIVETVEDPSKLTAEGLEFLLGEDLFEYYAYHRETINEMEEQAISKGLSPADYVGEQMGKLANKFEDLTKEKLDVNLRKQFLDRMYKKSLENRYYEILQDLVTLPGNFERLMSPISDAGLPAVAEVLDDATGSKEADLKNKLVSRSFMTSLRHAFVMGKKWVGISAVNITGHAIAQKVGLYFDPNLLDNLSEYDRSFLKGLRLSVPHNTVNVNGVEMISLGSRKTVDGRDEFISDRLSGYATAFVDVAKDPYILKIIKSDVVVGTAMLMERIGMGELTPYFLNQPIITQYLNHLDKVNSRSLFGKDNLETIRSQFPIKDDEALYDLSNEFVRNEDGTINFEESKNNLLEMIREEANRPSDQERSMNLNEKQRAVLEEFLTLSKLAQLNFKFTQAYNYDTTRVRNYDGFKKKLQRIEDTRNSNIISSVDKVMNETFIGDQMTLLLKELQSLGEVMKIDSSEIEQYTDNVINPFINDEYMSADDFDFVAKKIKMSFLDFIIQIKSDKILPDDLKNLFTGDNSVASRLLKMKKKYPQSNLLNNLIPYSSRHDGGPVKVSMKVKPTDPIDINRYIGMMRELKINEPDFYSDLVKLSILQGSLQSESSIADIVPLEDRSAYISPLIESLQASKTLENFNREGMFYRNNFRDDRIVPEVAPTYWNVEDVGDSVSIDYKSVNTFAQVLSHGITKGSGKIVTLNNKYSFINESDKDFIKMKRYQYVGGLMNVGVVDITTGKIFSVKNFSKLVNDGKASRSELVGYKKVKDFDGNPFTIQKKSKKSIDDFSVFKMVNLYGEPSIVAEYPKVMQPSIFNNNTYKVEEEIPDETIIAMLSGSETPVAPEQSTNKPDSSVTSQVAQEPKPIIISQSDKVERTTRMINRSELRKNPKTLYLFGDNDVRKGLGGQAREMRNEPNAIGISTKKLPATSEKSYKTDAELDQNKKIITDDINKAIAAWDSGKYDKLVIPQMGVGLAELPTRAPQTYAFLQEELQRLENHVNQIQQPIQPNLPETPQFTGIDPELQNELNKINMEPDDYSIVVADGVQYAITKKYTDKKTKPGYAPVFGRFINSNRVGHLYNGKILTVPGYENERFARLQELPGTILELSTGYIIPIDDVKSNSSDEEIVKALLDVLSKYDLQAAKAKAGTFKLNDPNIKVVPIEQVSSAGALRRVSVDQYNITVATDGKMFFANGKEVKDQTIKNKVDIRLALQDGTLKVSTYNKSKYFVLSDGRILGSGKTNLGKETVTNPDIRNKILMTAVLYKKTC